MRLGFAFLFLFNSQAIGEVGNQILNAAFCETNVSSEPLISFVLHLESSGQPLGRERLTFLANQIMGQKGASSPADDFQKAHPLVERILQDLVLRVTDNVLVGEWLLRHIEEKDGQAIDRNVAEEKTKSAFNEFRFVEIQGGEFRIPASLHGNGNKDLIVRVPYDFEVLDVPVTHAMWARVFGRLPQSFQEGLRQEDLSVISFGGREITLAPNHPILWVSIHSIMEFANRWSIEKNLRPAYLLTGGTGVAADGSLVAEESGMTEHFFSALEGYRFPSELEWMILAQDVHRELNSLSVDDQVKRLDQLGWFGENSGGFLSEVAQKCALEVSGGRIYDLLGSVHEVVHNFVVPSSTYNVADMLFIHEATPDSRVVCRSGDFLEGMEVGNSKRADKAYEEMGIRDSIGSRVGFRLVRTLRKLDPEEMR